jgi:hypothetical protein
MAWANQPARPYSSISMRPVTTGEILKGRSSSDSSSTYDNTSEQCGQVDHEMHLVQK